MGDNVRKLRCYINYDKEEQWLNDMAQKGYELEDVCIGYKFHSVDCENTIIKIDYRTFLKKSDFIDYCTLFEDSGWTHIAGSKNSGTQYFKKIDGNSDDDIFSDKVSKSGKYKRLSDMWLGIGVAYLPLYSVLISTGAIDANSIFHPKLLYLTPGLWEKTGADFLGAFLFETPFALMRGFSWSIILLVIILAFCFALKANKLYKKGIK